MQNSALLIIFEWIQFSGRMYAGPFWSGAHHLVCLVQFRNPFAPLGWSGAVPETLLHHLVCLVQFQKPFCTTQFVWCTTWFVWCSSRNPFAPLGWNSNYEQFCIKARIHCTRHVIICQCPYNNLKLHCCCLCSSSDGEHSRGHSPTRMVPSSYHSYPPLGTKEKTRTGSPSHIPGNLTMF